MDNSLTTPIKKQLKCFTFDFKGLYDSLNPNLVKQALRFAMEKCRDDWTEEFCDWLISLVDLSLRSSVGKYKDRWYLQKNGVPTGGSLWVQLIIIIFAFILQ